MPLSSEMPAVSERTRTILVNGHVCTACFFLALSCGPVSVVELAWIPLWISFLLHVALLPQARACAAQAVLSPVGVGVLAFGLWNLLSTTWSLDPTLGLWQIASFRWALLLPLLAPVMHRRRLLIAAFLCGTALGCTALLVNFVAQKTGWIPTPWHRGEHRHSGWWHPVIGGSILTAAVATALPTAWFGRGWSRPASIALVITACACVLLTGSRGAWIALALVLGLSTPVAFRLLLRSRRHTETRRPSHTPIVASALALCAVGLALWAAPSIRARADAAFDEVHAALHDNDFSSDTGARVLMIRWAWRAFLDQPVQGIGLGSYRRWAQARLDPHVASQRLPGGREPIMDHAHNTPLQILASTGAFGLALGTATVALALARGWRWTGRTDHAHNHAARPDLARIASALASGHAGPCLGIVGLMLAGLTDVVHINAQTSAVMFVLLALCTPRPAAPGSPR